MLVPRRPQEGLDIPEVFSDLKNEVTSLISKTASGEMKKYQNELKATRDEMDAWERASGMVLVPPPELSSVKGEMGNQEKWFLKYFEKYLDQQGKLPPGERKYASMDIVRSFHDASFKRFIDTVLEEVGEKPAAERRFPSMEKLHQMFMEQVSVGPEKAKAMRAASPSLEQASADDLQEMGNQETWFAEYFNKYLDAQGDLPPDERRFASMEMLKAYHAAAFKQYIDTVLTEIGKKPMAERKFPSMNKLHKLFMEQVGVGKEKAKTAPRAERLPSELLEEAEEAPAQKRAAQKRGGSSPFMAA